ncbi:ABC transporter substrate-binding protein [Spirosoma arcticum]
MSNHTTRRRFIKTLSLLSVAPSIVQGSAFLPNQTVSRIGYLSGAGVPELEKAFTDELQKLGFKDGANIRIEKRLARPNTADAVAMAAELAQMDLSLIVAASLPLALEIRKNNPNMPMVLATCPGMVSNGFAQSLVHPGGIYTGLDELPEGVTTKRLHLLKAAAPTVTRIALLSTTPGIGGHEIQLSEAEKTAATLGVSIKAYRAASLPQLEKALADLVSDGMNGLLSFQGALTLANRKLIADFAAQNRIPAMYQATLFAEAGGLMAWAPNLPQQFREVAHYVSQILKGANPGDLPAKHPEKYYLTLNKTAANKIGVSFSKELLAQATRVVE